MKEKTKNPKMVANIPDRSRNQSGELMLRVNILEIKKSFAWIG
jgi:hypothetical protein